MSWKKSYPENRAKIEGKNECEYPAKCVGSSQRDNWETGKNLQSWPSSPKIIKRVIKEKKKRRACPPALDRYYCHEDIHSSVFQNPKTWSDQALGKDTDKGSDACSLPRGAYPPQVSVQEPAKTVSSTLFNFHVICEILMFIAALFTLAKSGSNLIFHQCSND